MNNDNLSLGHLMADLQGLTLTDREREFLLRPALGGLVLFSRNYTSPHQLSDLVAAIRECNPELLIAVDQEGGRVQRFREGFLRLPSLHAIQQHFAGEREIAEQGARACAWAMAVELLAHGIDFSFAPVLDLYNADSSVIKERAFSADPNIVIALGRAYIDGMHSAGMAATGKHFPGHGTVAADSHVELPTDDRSFEELENSDLLAFAACLDLLDAIMPAHVIYPAVDSVSAGYSSIWIQDKLRGELKFDGVVFSDDLTMAAAHTAGVIETRAEASLQAGCDMVLVCNDPDSATAVAHWLEVNGHKGSLRLSKMRGNTTTGIEDLYSLDKWVEATALVKSIVN